MFEFRCTCVPTHMWRPKVELRSLLPSLSTSSLRKALSTEPELAAKLICLAFYSGDLPLYLLSTGNAGGPPYPLDIYMGARDLNSGPHIFVTSSFTTQPSPSPLALT